MKWSARYWLVAAAVSALVHAAVLLPFAVSGESVQIERSAGAPVVVASLSAAQALNAGEDAPDSTQAEPDPVEPVDTLQEAEAPAREPETAQVEPVETPPSVVEPATPDQIVKSVEMLEQAKSTPDKMQPVEPVKTEAISEISEAPVVPAISGIAVAAEAIQTRLKEATPVNKVDEAKITETALAATSALKPEEQPVRTARAAPVDPSEELDQVTPEKIDPVIRPAEKPKPKAKKRKVKKPESKKPDTRKKKAKKKKAKKRKTTRKKAEKRSVASLRRSGSRAQGSATQRAGDRGRNRSVTGRAAISNYLGRIVSRLQRQKRYPADARRRKMEGTVVVAFTVRSNGQVSGVRLKRSSGHAALDREVRAMIKRAAPFPPMPQDSGRKALSLSVPINFKMR